MSFNYLSRIALNVDTSAPHMNLEAGKRMTVEKYLKPREVADILSVSQPTRHFNVCPR